MRKLFKLLVVAIALSVASPAVALPVRYEGLPPNGPAAQHFPADFTPPVDSQWGFPIGGFGGLGTAVDDGRPVTILVHGNNVDHATWFNVASRLVGKGWDPQKIWALSYDGVGCTDDGALFSPNAGYMGYTYQADRAGAGVCHVTSNDINVADLANFTRAVLTYTGASRFQIVGHSLGVTLARKMLKTNPLLADKLDAFVGIAGGNHGTSLCPPNAKEVMNGCEEIEEGSAWLADLNGTDETPGNARYMTVYDGSGAADPAFVGPYAQSPRLEGALNCEYPLTYHNDLRVAPAIIDAYAAFLDGTSSTC